MSEPQRPDRPPRKNGRPSAPGVRFGRGIFGWVLFILLAVMLFVLVQGKNREAQKIDAGTFWTYFNNNQVKELTIRGDEIVGEFNSTTALSDGRSTKYFRVEFPQNVSTDWQFTKDSCTVACPVLRERSPAVDAREGTQTAHSPAKIRYTTPRDAIDAAGTHGEQRRRSRSGPGQGVARSAAIRIRRLPNRCSSALDSAPLPSCRLHRLQGSPRENSRDATALGSRGAQHRTVRVREGRM